MPNEEDKEPSATNNFLASIERTENSIRLKCYDCFRWADLRLKLNTEYIINDFGFSEGKTIKRDKYAFTIKATKNQVVFKGLKNTAWKDLKFTLNNNNTQQFFNQLGMVSNQKNTQEKVTPEMIKEYNSLAKKMKTNKSGHFKLKDIERLKFIYNLMTDKQKKGAESFPNIPPPPTVISIKVKNIPPPPPIPTKATKYQKRSIGNIKKPLLDSNGDEIIIGHRIANSSISENYVRHPSILKYTDYAEKFLELQRPRVLDFKNFDKLYNDIPLSERTSIMTPDYIIKNKDLLKKMMDDNKIKK